MAREVIAKVHWEALFRDVRGSLLQVRQDVATYGAKHLEQNDREARKVAKATFAITSRRYFTFLELAIALSILMVVSLALYAYSHGVSQSWSQMVKEKNRFQEMLNLDRTIDAVLANAVPFTWKSDDAINEDGSFPFIVAEYNSLRLAYLHDLHDSVEGALRFAEFVVKDENLYLTYSDRPFYQWGDLGGRDQTVLLAENVRQITFSYLDWSADEDDNWENRALWLDEWETEDSGRMDAPLAIIMTVEWTDGRQESWMRRTMGNSYRERFGKWTPLDEDKR